MSGYTFSKWSNNITENPYRFNMPADNVEVRAIFEGIPYKVITVDGKEGKVKTSKEKAVAEEFPQQPAFLFNGFQCFRHVDLLQLEVEHKVYHNG